MIWNFVLQHMKDVKKKIWRRRGPAVLVLCLAVIVQGCAGYPADKDGGHREQNKTNENGRLSVVTTIFPPYDFVREIAGDCVDLKMLLKPGEESHSYEPTPQELLDRMELFIHLWNALNSLPEVQGVRVEAHLILGKSYRQIAREQGVDKSVVRRSVKRGMAAMKKYLKKVL